MNHLQMKEEREYKERIVEGIRKSSYKKGKRDMLKKLLNKKYTQLYNANTILLLNQLNEIEHKMRTTIR